ncbi:MAG: hypothetical protein ACR2N7_08950 [Acidimicrobiia bacterium]
MATQELNDQLESIPGVASAEVTISPGTAPVAKIWLDGSRDGAEVRERVDSLLGSALPTHFEDDDAPPKRRSGLGRGLSELLPADELEPAPSHINGGRDIRVGRPMLIRRVAVVESLDGVDVEIEDADGTKATTRVGEDGSIDTAVIDAVRSLAGIPDSVDLRPMDVSSVDGDVVVVSAHESDGRRAAGAAFVDFGRPWALARAVFQALDGI